jgi:hypothetical protein
VPAKDSDLLWSAVISVHRGGVPGVVRQECFTPAAEGAPPAWNQPVTVLPHCPESLAGLGVLVRLEDTFMGIPNGAGKTSRFT